jgi:hypothetical protein
MLHASRFATFSLVYSFILADRKERAASEIYFLPEALKGILLALALALKRIPQNEKILFD